VPSEFLRRHLDAETLVESLRRREKDPDRPAFVLETLGEEPDVVGAGRLLAQAERFARGLRALGADRGDRILLILPTSTEFVFSYWGTLLAAATPVPAYPPAGLAQLGNFVRTLRGMIAACKAPLLVAPELLRVVLADAGETLPSGTTLVTPEEVRAAASDSAPLPTPPKSSDLALIQFSSGSTGDPKGICLTHSNILANVTAFLSRMDVTEDDGCVTWLPLYHDMGLIGTMLGPMMIAAPLALIPPTDFLRRPAFWLECLGRHRATISVAPQFAFNLCLRKIKPADLPHVDLSRLRVLLNGAEPIHVDGVRAFEERFAPIGLRRGVVTPCYGLAEGTLAAAMLRPGSPVVTHAPEATAVESGGEERGTARPSAVSVGPAMDGVEIRIRGADGGWVGDGVVGEICLRGASICRGLLGADGERPSTDADGWLATRDLGFLRSGDLHVTGRIKDLIILGGRNLYPQDLEAVASELPGFRPGRVAAFGVAVAERATEALVVVAETTEENSDLVPGHVTELRRQLRERFGVIPWDTVLLKRGHLPLTTSGKLRRAKTREDYEAGALREVVYRARSGRAAVAAEPALDS
jgi:acyl-CoA synthetase (AMP-forming)/AMP-acid ligase II